MKRGGARLHARTSWLTKKLVKCLPPPGSFCGAEKKKKEEVCSVVGGRRTWCCGRGTGSEMSVTHLYAEATSPQNLMRPYGRLLVFHGLIAFHMDIMAGSGSSVISVFLRAAWYTGRQEIWGYYKCFLKITKILSFPRLYYFSCTPGAFGEQLVVSSVFWDWFIMY